MPLRFKAFLNEVCQHCFHYFTRQENKTSNCQASSEHRKSTFIRWFTVKISPLISADVYMIDTVSLMYTRQQRQNASQYKKTMNSSETAVNQRLYVRRWFIEKQVNKAINTR